MAGGRTAHCACAGRKSRRFLRGPPEPFPWQHGGRVPAGDQAGDAERLAGYPVVRGPCLPSAAREAQGAAGLAFRVLSLKRRGGDGTGFVSRRPPPPFPSCATRTSLSYCANKCFLRTVVYFSRSLLTPAGDPALTAWVPGRDSGRRGASPPLPRPGFCVARAASRAPVPRRRAPSRPFSASWSQHLRPEVSPFSLCLPSEADPPSSPLDVWVAADRVETRGGGSCRAAALPAGVSLAPSSCRGLRRLPGDGLHLRMRLHRPPPSAGKGGAGPAPPQRWAGRGGGWPVA